MIEFAIDSGICLLKKSEITRMVKGDFHIFRVPFLWDCYGNSMGPAYHKGVSLLGVPETPTEMD